MQSFMWVFAGIVALVLVTPSLGAADILMWCDQQGVKHYTNATDGVPADQTASLVLHETARVPDETPPEQSPLRRGSAPAARQQIELDETAVASAYAEGYQRALASAQQQIQAPAVNVQIVGPLVAAAAGGGSGYDYGDGASWFDYNSPALVTTSFDRGRSRHLTLRMLMQDQFAVDREGPYLIVNRFPPRGPGLQTVMPRGLPQFVRPGSGLVNRVITH